MREHGLLPGTMLASLLTGVRNYYRVLKIGFPSRLYGVTQPVSEWVLRVGYRRMHGERRCRHCRADRRGWQRQGDQQLPRKRNLLECRFRRRLPLQRDVQKEQGVMFGKLAIQCVDGEQR